MDRIDRNGRYTLIDGRSGFSIAFAGMKFEEADIVRLAPLFGRAAREMARIEAGEIKNPDEKRRVTHFTDRISYPQSALFSEVESFAAGIRSGEIKGSTGKTFDALVVNGIGGSALGPQLMQFAVNGPYWNELSAEKRGNNLKLYFLDNTDSAEFADLLEVMDPERTLQLVISKSGGTRETKNNMIAMESFYASRGLGFARHAVAVTMSGSELDRHARSNGWLKVFEMAESIGGRTSETSIVGHVPAALTGVDFKKFLAGACAMDAWTRDAAPEKNPAMMLAAMWYIAGNGRGDRNMVIVPYSDRLVLLSRYLQQLVMESLGKELDLDGKTVHQGLNVFGNKGGTDAHAFIQQLNDGRDDFFATFIEILADAKAIDMGDGVRMGDYLHGFLEGLSSALRGKGRQIIRIGIPKLDEFSLGQIIALYERAVAIYAEFININAFHQPGVQAYKLAANGILKLASGLRAELKKIAPVSGTAADIAGKIGKTEQAAEIAGLLDKAALNTDGVSRSFDASSGSWVYTVK
ncbi:MAG: glucose-6-phosphate isomerase [Lentisphaeria bacterium]|nr:glucose-6-phosphate isomerase [Lentisphaeria bacterium]